MVPSGETLRSARTSYPDVLCRGRANAVQLAVYNTTTGALDAPTQAGSTFTLYDPSGTAVVNAAAVTVSGSIATYTILAASLPTSLTSLGEGWREIWSLIYSGVAVTFERTAALARVNLAPSVVDADILALYPSWSRARGSAVTSFGPWIVEAWKKTIQRLLLEGHLPYLIRTPDALREAHLNLAIALVAYGVKPSASAEDTTWLQDAQRHEKMYEASWNRANWQVDLDHDGVVDDPSRRTRPGVAVHTFGVTASGRRVAGL